MAWSAPPWPPLFEPGAVQGDHLLDVFLVPEDVVVEEAVAVERGLFGDFRGADRAVPTRTAGCRRGASAWRCTRAAARETAFPSRRRVRARGAAGGSSRSRAGCPGGCPCRTRGRPGRCCRSPARVDAAVGQVLQHREVLGDLHRIVRGDERRRGRQMQCRGLRGDPAEHRGRRGRHEGRVVVLTGREDVESGSSAASAIFVIAVMRSCSVGMPTRGGVARHVADGEDAELHCRTSVV